MSTVLIDGRDVAKGHLVVLQNESAISQRLCLFKIFCSKISEGPTLSEILKRDKCQAY